MHTQSTPLNSAASRLSFAVALRDALTGDRTVIMTARSEADALRKAVKAGLNVKAVRLANVRAADVAPPVTRTAAPAVVKVPRTPKPAPAPKAPADPAFEREWAALLADEARENAARAERAYWLTGEGSRPARASRTAAPVAGAPKHAITVRPRPGVGAPFVGDASKARPDQRTRVAHEYVAPVVYVPTWNPSAHAPVLV